MCVCSCVSRMVSVSKPSTERLDSGNEDDSINAEAASEDTSNHSAGEGGPFT